MTHLEHALAEDRPVLLVGNHAMDVVDPLLFAAVVHDATGRHLPFIAHEMLFFRLPGVRDFVRGAGMIPSREPLLAERTLREQGLLMLYPGAGQEAALRSYEREPYTLKWYERFGFVELALRTRATLLFVAGVGIDEMFFQTDVPLPRPLFRLVGNSYLNAYRGIRIQLGAAGIHVLPGWFPLPVRVTHVVSPPLPLDLSIDPTDRVAVGKAQVAIWGTCQRLLDDAVDGRRTDLVDAGLRGGMRLLRAVGL